MWLALKSDLVQIMSSSISLEAVFGFFCVMGPMERSVP